MRVFMVALGCLIVIGCYHLFILNFKHRRFVPAALVCCAGTILLAELIFYVFPKMF